MEFIKTLFGQRVYLDTNIFIYAYEAHPRFIGAVTDLFAEIEKGNIRAVTSELTLAEVLVMPIFNKNRKAQRLYRQALRNSGNFLVHPINRRFWPKPLDCVLCPASHCPMPFTLLQRAIRVASMSSQTMNSSPRYWGFA